MKNICLGLLVFSILIFGAGCGSSGIAAADFYEQESTADNTQNSRETISSEDDKAAKELLIEYFTALFTNAIVDEYNENSKTGIIPDNIREYIADKTLSEGDGNPEVGIHLPRYISINGMTIISYNVEMLPKDQGQANIVSNFISKEEDNYLYFNKIIAKANVVPDEVFSQAYRKEADNTYTKLREINSSEIDGMRIEIRYDVELEKSEGKFKVLRAIESNIKSGMKNRLFILNNDNITRLPYLDLTRTEDNSEYVNTADGEIYETEKAVITKFFQNFTKLDRERMNLLSYKWKQGYMDVAEYWESLGITQSEDGIHLIELNHKYDKNYPFNSLPLRNNMEEMKEIKNFVVTPHPAYSEKIRWYYVNFDATVRRTNGITDEHFTYSYDYMVSLSKNEDNTIIEKFELNEYYNIPK